MLLLARTQQQLNALTIRNLTLPVIGTRRWESKKSKKKRDKGGTFMANEMEVNILPDERLQRKPEEASVKFGKGFTDYMFSVRWTDEDGWGIPKIEPVSRFRIHPASKCLHYGVELFEGLKAYRGYDEYIRLFRPDLNMKRMLHGASRLHMPGFNPDEFIECIKRLVKLEQDWIPKEEGSSLYIRPVFVGTEASLRVTPPRSALLYVILSSIPTAKNDPISLYADPRYVKSWPGGIGDIKAGGNYASLIALQRLAETKECQQILWIQGPNGEITDMGNMNIFFVMKKEGGERELVTPPANGLILNGVIRQSILQLCNEWKNFGVVERSVTMKDFKSLLENKKICEVFGTGTYHTVAPVCSILYNESQFDIPTMKQDRPIYTKIRRALTDIFYGKVDHEWGVRVDN